MVHGNIKLARKTVNSNVRYDLNGCTSIKLVWTGNRKEYHVTWHGNGYVTYFSSFRAAYSFAYEKAQETYTHL